MRKARKLALTFLSVLFALTFVLGLVACGGQSAKDAINAYLLAQDNQLVDEDFTLPKKIGLDGGVEVEWKSDNDAITIEEGTSEAYNAKVTMKDEVTNVKLTISSGSASKDFNVRVDALTASKFMEKYTNAEFSKSHKENFALDTKTPAIQGQTADIAWEVKATADKAYLDVEEIEGVTTAVVHPDDDLYKAKLTGTFTFKGATATTDYDISVLPDLTHHQFVNKIYSQSGFPIDEYKGYVVHVYSKSEDYGGNATFYAIDEDLCSGYYFYQAGVDPDDLDKVVEGAHFTFSGDTSKNYNGLWEINGKEVGKAVFDDEPAIDIEETVTDIGAYILANGSNKLSSNTVPLSSLLWHESTLVKLTGWKVDSVESSIATKKTAFTLVKDDIKVAVYLSTYINYAAGADDALVAKCKTLKAGDFVDVTGILGYSSGFQLQPRTEADIVKANAEATPANAADLKAAVAAVNDAAKNAGFGALVREHKEVTMPATQDGLKITYSLQKKTAEAHPPVTVDEATGKITVDPQNTDLSRLVEVAYTVDGEDDPIAYSVFTIRSWNTTDENIVNEVKNNILKVKMPTITAAGEYAFPEVDDIGTTIEWTFAEKPAWADITNVGNKYTLVVNYLPLQKVDTLKVYVEVKLNGKTSGKISFIIKNIPAISTLMNKPIETPTAGATYNIAMKAADSAYHYLTGAMDGFYMATSSDITKGLTVTLEGSATDGWKLKAGNGKYIEIVESSGHYNAVYSDTSTTTCKWDDVSHVFYWTFGSSTLKRLGTSGTYTTIATRNHTVGEAIGSGEYYVVLLVSAEMDDADKAQWVVDDLAALPATRFTATNGNGIALNTYNAYNPTSRVTWTITSTNDNSSGQMQYVALNGGDKLQIKAIPQNTDTTVYQYTLTASAKVGNETKTRIFNFSVAYPNDGSQLHPYAPSEAVAAAKALTSGSYSTTQVYVKGYVVDAGTWSAQYSNWSNVYVGDTATTAKTDALLVFYLKPDSTGGGHLLADDLSVKSEITVYGYLQNYQGTTFEMAKKDNDYPVAKAYTDVRTDAQKAEAAAKAAKATLDATTVAYDVTTITAPDSTVTGVTLAFKVGSTDLAEHTVSHTTEETTVTVTITATSGTAGTNTQTATVKIAKGLPQGATEATKETLDFSAWTGIATPDAKPSDNTKTGTVTSTNGVTFTAAKGTGSSDPAYNTQWRLYANNTLAISVTGGKKIFYVKITYENYKSGKLLNGSADYVSGSILYAEGDGSSINLTVSTEGQARITKIEIVTYTPAT